MYSKNIFLTGDLHVGKSTIVQNVLNRLKVAEIGGYRTEVIFENGKKLGFKMISFSGEEKIFAHASFTKGKRFGDFRVQLEVFESFGAQILTTALEQNGLIVIDEIGAMEKHAQKFREVIYECLDAPIPVLGVFQQRAKWAKAMLEARNDCKIFAVERLNQRAVEDSVYHALTGIFSGR
ncbi:MAG: hypothetical protein GXO74_07445 [Calditrichaeota bacterium]|nr:hypothetical protein [Calditrichota bacterium]